jgi:ferritin-like metal-binding protein YciE
MAKIRTMDELFEHELEDLLSAEQQLMEALPKMAEAATSSALKTAFKDHLKQTKTHVSRIEKAFKTLGKEPKAHTCKGMQGLIKEGEDIIKNATDAAVLDAGLISAAQRVEHYEISAYGSARAHAQALGHTALVDLLQTSLDEEGATNKLLTQLAEGRMSFAGANEKALA